MENKNIFDDENITKEDIIKYYDAEIKRRELQLSKCKDKIEKPIIERLILAYKKKKINVVMIFDIWKRIKTNSVFSSFYEDFENTPFSIQLLVIGLIE